MIRTSLGDQAYWTRWEKFRLETIRDETRNFQTPGANPIYRPQYVWNHAGHRLRYMLTLYSMGRSVRLLSVEFSSVLDAWELSNRLSEEVCAENSIQTCRDWAFSLSNLNHYNWCFWLVGLALAFQVPAEQWQRLMMLIGAEGQDMLLDRVIASRSPGRSVGTVLLHAKPYARLLAAVDAPKDQQPMLLRDFVDHWYTELKRPAPRNKMAPTIEPFWYAYGDPEKHTLEMGSYFGRWCIEAVAAVKAFGLNDSLCLGHDHYPGDLLRPDGPSTHPLREAPKSGWLLRLLKGSASE